MNENKSKTTSQDEIDISQMFAWIGKGFRNAGENIIWGIAGLRNLFFSNLTFFSIIILAGLAVGASYSQLLKKKFYKSSMIINCDYMNNRIMENSIEKLNLLCAEPEREGLAEVLNIDLDVAKNIRKFSAQPFVSEKDMVEIEVLKEQLTNAAEQKKDLVDKIISRINIENNHAFLIEVLIYNPDIVKNLEKALVNFFANNGYVKNRVEVTRENLLARKSKLQKESVKLDSLKVILYQNLQSLARQSREGSNNVILAEKNLTNPLDVYIQDLNLNQELLDIESKLYINPDFEVIDGFTVFKEPESAGLVRILGISFWVSFVAGYVIIGLWKFDKHLASYQKKSS